MMRLRLAALALLLATASAAAALAPQKVAIVVFEGVEVLDVGGPAEVFAAAARQAASNGEPAFTLYTVATTRQPIESQGFLDLIPDYAITEAPAPDILILPGGRVEHATGDPALMAWIASAAAAADQVLTICYGSFVAGRAGLLDGLEATTWYGSVARLGAEFPRTRAVSGRRFVDNGKVVTTAGVAAGIDGALHVVARTVGKYAADRTAEYMEYPWAPPSFATVAYPLLDPRLDERGRSLQEAAIAVRERQIERALAIYRSLTIRDGEDFEAWYELGATLHAAGRGEEAIAAYRQAGRGGTQRGAALYNLACLYAVGGRVDAALDAMARAIAAGARSAAAYEQDPDFAALRADPRFRRLLSGL